MRTVRGLITVLVASTMLGTGPLLTTPPAEARASGGGVGESEQVIREGLVVEIGDTTITIHEWAGKYTYRLSPTGRQTLETYQIRPGDRVQFHVWAVWEVAYYFRKI